LVSEFDLLQLHHVQAHSIAIRPEHGRRRRRTAEERDELAPLHGRSKAEESSLYLRLKGSGSVDSPDQTDAPQPHTIAPDARLSFEVLRTAPLG